MVTRRTPRARPPKFLPPLGGPAPAPRPTFWWAVPPQQAEARLTWRAPRLSPVRGGLGLFLTLSRRGRQLSAEVAGGLSPLGAAGTSPITTFTGGWIAHLLGYGRKYRGARIVETFLATALRTYLLVYPFAPLCLGIKGAVAQFGPFWRALNRPAQQVFRNPLTTSLI